MILNIIWGIVKKISTKREKEIYLNNARDVKFYADDAIY